MNESYPRRALVSTSDKTGLGPFVGGLVELEFEILSTGGTRRFLENQGIKVIEVSSYTGFPEIMAGRVKTLHPKIHGAILGRPDLSEDIEAMEIHGILPFELVVCNLYPFDQTVARKGVTAEEVIEQIDVGGPSMVRAAAKNHAYTGIVTDPSQYRLVLNALRDGRLSDPIRRSLAAEAFELTATYDRAISDYMASQEAQRSKHDDLASSSLQNKTAPEQIARGSSVTDKHADRFPNSLSLRFQRLSELRYGENPHQNAAFYSETAASIASLASAEQLHGKELSYNNLLDLDSALSIVREFDQPAAVVIKHNNPCGCAWGSSLAVAFAKAYAGDPLSAFGSVLGFNRPIDLATAEQMCEPQRFIEAVIAPGFDEDAIEALMTRPKWKKNVRLMRCPISNDGLPRGLDYRRVTGGLLVQDRDEQPDPQHEWQIVSERTASDAEKSDLTFAWKVCKHVRSNTIVFAKDGAIVGVGAGQMSRLDAAFMAAHKAGARSHGAVVASDAFFPFRDGIDQVAQAGITAVIQPGGSRNDEEVITACREHHLAMIFTGRRHFKH